MAEYEACSMGVRMAYEMKVKQLRVLGDSLLGVHQLNGEWETRDAKLIPYNDYIRTIAQTFDSITFEHVPCESNQVADALATLSAMFNVAYSEEVQPIRMEKYKTPSYCMSLERKPDGKPWYHDIKHYIAYREYPSGVSENSKRTVRRLAMKFFLSGEVLYKRNYDMTLLRCVDALKAKKSLEEIHEGVCGTHANGHMMARQILRAGYFWLTMESDCIKYVRRCHKCQIYADKTHAPASPLHVLTAPWPFSMWGLDVIGPIEPKASNGHRFILVAIDYFTKWVEAASYKSVTKQAVIKFI
ncbi:putative RNA-directed DNA polymerase (Reverse transcriptase), Ribonuclease H [Cucumis melo var. makuwa]|uniref:RNA-directed DNA polymerase (Reverse transcriptase), Ribonuclease H n=1 Tax=Cucumis melo var. makuwa TaxID=1194695 RepID=A0A5A7SQN1_CUCMM|nr:putative RNA-directed DNA polymerase (Reverse transcriptase), Ribonuclease H [Cucumis melo var. makuwa]